MEWVILIIVFTSGELRGLQSGLPFPSFKTCSQQMEEVSKMYRALSIEADYFCIPVGEKA